MNDNKHWFINAYTPQEKKEFESRNSPREGYEWVRKSEYPRPPREWGSDWHETELGYAKGKSPDDIEKEEHEKMMHTPAFVYPLWYSRNEDGTIHNGITAESVKALAKIEEKIYKGEVLTKNEDEFWDENQKQYLINGRDKDDPRTMQSWILQQGPVIRRKEGNIFDLKRNWQREYPDSSITVSDSESKISGYLLSISWSNYSQNETGDNSPYGMAILETTIGQRCFLTEMRLYPMSHNVSVMIETYQQRDSEGNLIPFDRPGPTDIPKQKKITPLRFWPRR